MSVRIKIRSSGCAFNSRVRALSIKVKDPSGNEQTVRVPLVPRLTGPLLAIEDNLFIPGEI